MLLTHCFIGVSVQCHLLCSLYCQFLTPILLLILLTITFRISPKANEKLIYIQIYGMHLANE